MRINLKIVLIVSCFCFLFFSCTLPYKLTPSAPQTNQIIPTDQESTSISTPALPLLSLPEINTERLYTTLTDITSFQAYSGWRTAGSQGEQEALDYVQTELGNLPFLNNLGMHLERQNFHIPQTTEIWQVSLSITWDGMMYSIPANGLQGLDSDGNQNDSSLNPVQVSGSPLLVRTQSDLFRLSNTDVNGRLLWLDFELLDVNTTNQGDPYFNKQQIIALAPAGIILVTQFSNTVGVSHGTFALDSGYFRGSHLPVIQIALEDLVNVGLSGWEDIPYVGQSTLIWDQDVLSPGTSGNLIASIPGRDTNHNVILSAHIDSAGTPGALDDGSGSVILLEIARVLNEQQIQPNLNLVLVWFGSEEAGLYGSANFVNSHSDVLDQTIANLQIDCLSRPLDGVQARLQIAFWSGSWSNETLSPWAQYISHQAYDMGIDTGSIIMNLSSDNSNFDGFGIPNLDLILDGDNEMEDIGGTWYGGHLHDPYDTVDLARDVSVEFSNIAQLALAAALLPADLGSFSETPSIRARAVFISSHNESGYMSPVGLSGLSIALINSGYDVDVIPYGTPVTTSYLTDANMVFLLPTFDFPESDPPTGTYDEEWSNEEILAVQNYLNNGGLLVVASSANSLGYYNSIEFSNEDLTDLNTILANLGITYMSDWVRENWVDTSSESQLMNGVQHLLWVHENAVPFRVANGEILAQINNENIAALIPIGQQGGEILALADLSILGTESSGLLNHEFVQNLVAYGLAR